VLPSKNNSNHFFTQKDFPINLLKYFNSFFNKSCQALNSNYFIEGINALFILMAIKKLISLPQIAKSTIQSLLNGLL
jgi:hypothetical protein